VAGLNGRAKRVGRLEETITAPPCEECGHGDLSKGPPTYELCFDDDLDEDEEPVEAWCSTCGRQTDHVLRFEDDD
jgi:hypothetical protein